MRLLPPLPLAAQLLVGSTSFSSVCAFSTGHVKLQGSIIQPRDIIHRRNYSMRPHPTAIGRSCDTQVALAALPAGLPVNVWPTIQSALLGESYPKALAALAGVGSAVVVPLTIWRQAYSFSVGYGFSVAAMSATLLSAFSIHLFDFSSSAALIPSLAVVYGIRLATFLLVREYTVTAKRDQVREFDKSNRLSRIPFAVFVAGFYAMMTSPILSVLRTSVEATSPWKTVQWVGTGVAAIGLLFEAVADHHKYVVKLQNPKGFMGPTGGLYALCRHPNYLGEVLFWLGVFITGIPTFGKSVAAWLPASLGLYGIVSIMNKATERLDSKQADKYGGDAVYEKWRDDTKAALVPFIQG